MSAANKPLALVFGGSRGIGAACVQALLRDGHDVGFTYVSTPVDLAGARGYRADVVDAAAVAEVFAQVQRDFGRPADVVVANAGINVPPAPLAQFPPADFRKLVEVNLLGAFNILSQAARRVADGGAIVALTSSMVRHAVPGGGPYTASKAAVESLVHSLAKELAPRRVRVNAVAPGPIDTDLFRAGKSDEAKQRSAAMSPLNRVGTPQEVAEVVAFLASSRASWIDGQIVQPNGGMV
ncbi:MAG TPA: SDR family oxidoreductase [Ramlibacter sp.]|nr:SDR family oxidoreductase [Ramlibacter sp.]